MAGAADRIVAVLAGVPARHWLALGLLVAGLVVGVLLGGVNRRLLRRFGVDEAVEGTAFERTLRDLGTSTVVVVAKLSTYFVWGLALIFALSIAELQFASRFWNGVVTLLPRAFVAVLVLIVGIVVGDKVELLVGERLRGLKVPQAAVLAPLARYTVLFVAALLALAQLNIAIGVLLLLLAGYLAGVVVLSAVAFRDLLASGAAGAWVLLNEPYGIGDRIRIDGREGIVQEVEVFATTVEDEDGTEYVIPNRDVVREGVARLGD
ncbi:MAG: mechanosensitive ion channel domain-containing protein [Halobacteriales archaeon]